MRSFSFILMFLLLTGTSGLSAAFFFTANIDSLDKYKYSRSEQVLAEIKTLEKARISQSDSERLLIIKAAILARKGKTDSAYTIYNSFIANEKKLANKLALADAYSGIGRIWEQKRDIGKLIYYSGKALQLGRLLNNYGIINVAANDIGYGYIYKDRYDSAALFFTISYEANRALGDSLRMASCQNNLFVSYFRLGKFEKAVESLLTSIRIKEKFRDPKSYLSGMLNLADVYIKLERYPEAQSTIRKAIAGCSSYNFNDLKVTLFSNHGAVFSKLNQTDSALIYHQKALALADSLGLELEKGKALRNIGSVYETLGNDRLAIKYGTEALAILKKHRANRSIGFAENNLAISYLNLNQPHNARRHIDEARRISTEINEPELHSKVNNVASRYYEMTGDYRNALKHYRIHQQYEDSLNSLSTQKIIHELEAKYESEKKENEIIRLTGENQLKQFELAEKAQQIRQNRIVLFSTISVIILILISVYLFFNRYKLQQRNLQTELQRQKLEIEHRMLRSQMNPHFIFNSLTSISNLIQLNDMQQANAYLLKFSGLLRSILENSRSEFISLSDEIEMMKLYAQAEQIRHQHSFDCDFGLGVEECEFVAIPPMLMQPFLENAIKHAFNGISHRGKITVRYTADEQQLHCCIEDNGVGINHSQQHNGHKSMALTLIGERINILKKEWDENIELTIADISETDNNHTGTRVTLILPVKDL